MTEFSCPHCGWRYDSDRWGVAHVPVHTVPGSWPHATCEGSDSSPVDSPQLDLRSFLPQPGRPAA